MTPDWQPPGFEAQAGTAHHPVGWMKGTNLMATETWENLTPNENNMITDLGEYELAKETTNFFVFAREVEREGGRTWTQKVYVPKTDMGETPPAKVLLCCTWSNR